jgi:GT2 family glycosyltransferase
MKEYKVYIIVVTYNGIQWIENCLNSIIKSSIKNDVVVVDNNSTDGTTDLIIEKFPNVHLIRCTKNLGFGKANNIGLKIALEQNADYVFLLNQDASIESNTIEGLIRIHLDNPQYWILAPIRKTDNLHIENDVLSNIFSKGATNLISDLILGNPVSDIYTLSFIGAAGWLLPIACIRNIGGFDPLFFHYGEDNDYCERVLNHGYKIGLAVNYFITHYVGQRLDSKKMNNRKTLAKTLFTLKHNHTKKLRWYLSFIPSIYFDIKYNRQNFIKKVLTARVSKKLCLRNYPSFLD